MIVNAHTHLEHSDKGDQLPEPSAAFTQWISGLIASNQGRTPEQSRAACEAGVQALLAVGTTHVGDISATGLSVLPLARSGLQGIVWLEVLGPTMEVGLQRLDYAKGYINELREQAANSPIRVGATLHSPYSLHPELWEPALRWVEAEALPLCVHLAESPAEWELLSQGSGPMRRFAEERGIPPLPLPQSTPVQYLASKGVLDLEPLLVHMVHVTDEDIALVRAKGATVVHCPRSNARLECGRMPLERYAAAGVPLLLGTDSRASSPSLDVREEAAFAETLHAGLVAPALLQAMLHDALTFEAHYR